MKRKSKGNREQPGQQLGSKAGREVVFGDPGKLATCHRAQTVARAVGSHGGFCVGTAASEDSFGLLCGERWGCIGVFAKPSHTPGLQIRKSWFKEVIWLPLVAH